MYVRMSCLRNVVAYYSMSAFILWCRLCKDEDYRIDCLHWNHLQRWPLTNISHGHYEILYVQYTSWCNENVQYEMDENE